jgi:hypothetical protein
MVGLPVLLSMSALRDCRLVDQCEPVCHFNIGFRKIPRTADCHFSSAPAMVFIPHVFLKEVVFEDRVPYSFHHPKLRIM